MAGFEDDKDDLFDTQRLSLLDVIEERNRALNKKSMLNRMVVVGKLRSDMADKRDLGQHYEKVIGINEKFPDGNDPLLIALATIHY